MTTTRDSGGLAAAAREVRGGRGCSLINLVAERGRISVPRLYLYLIARNFTVPECASHKFNPDFIAAVNE